MLTLYYGAGACSLASHIVLEEIGAPYEAKRVDLAGGEQNTPAYRAINPRGRVPALITDKGLLNESPAILCYLADLHPEKGLLPADPFARAQAAALMSWIASSWHPAFAHVFRPGRYHPDPAAHEAMKAHNAATYREGFDEIEERLKGREWVFGAYSVVDPYLLVFYRFGTRLGVDFSVLPAVKAHAERVAARPATQAAFASEGIGLTW